MGWPCHLKPFRLSLDDVGLLETTTILFLETFAQTLTAKRPELTGCKGNQGTDTTRKSPRYGGF